MPPNIITINIKAARLLLIANSAVLSLSLFNSFDLLIFIYSTYNLNRRYHYQTPQLPVKHNYPAPYLLKKPVDATALFYAL
jgi:hypothetical protein